jgi:hypothetical protein
MKAARRMTLAPAPTAPVVSLAEWRSARRIEAEPVLPEPPPPPALRLVVEGEAPPPFRLEVFLRRARAVMSEPHEGPRLHAYRDAEPA